MENNYLKLFLADMQKLWANLSLLQKFALVILSVVTIAAASYFLVKSTEPNWTVLYSDLMPQDTVAITEGLRKDGYQFKVSADKTTVLVPAHLQDELRLYIAENNLIKDSSPGFELLDELQLGSTDFKNKLTKQRIFQGELTRTIEKISGVKKARVQLAEPERSIFTENDEAPTASVMLILEPGYVLKSNQVKAIKNLVAYAVPRLTPEKVFLTDQSGNSLTDEIEKSATDIESFRYNFENQTTKKIQAVLDKITGVGNSSVQVSAEIDFNSVRSTIESYLPTDTSGQGVLTSQQSESEVYQNPNQAGGGTESTASDGTSVNKKLNYEKQKNSTNYSVSKEIKQVVYAPGSVKRMTIAVAVNKILTEQEREELTNLILSASGANTERGDVINISSIEFAASDTNALQDQKTALKNIETRENIEFWANKVVSPLIILILGITALFILRSLLQNLTAGKEDDYTETAALPIKDELDEMVNIEPLLQLEAKLDPELEKMKTDLTETILSDPSEATRLLMNYIKE